MVNGGILYSPSMVKRNASSDPGRRVIQQKTSLSIRQLLRLNVIEGTGKMADLPGFEIGGKTGTAEKAARGGYRQKALISSFVASFPMSDPKFIVVVSIDEPKGNAETYGFATAGFVAAPSIKVIVDGIASLYGILPGDFKQGLPAEIASTPVPQQQPQQPFVSASARHRGGVQEPRKALPVRPSPNQAAAAPPTGVRSVATE
jgi:cell division protein FtsI (penicillin-binding protein 3)